MDRKDTEGTPHGQVELVCVCVSVYACMYREKREWCVGYNACVTKLIGKHTYTLLRLRLLIGTNLQ